MSNETIPPYAAPGLTPEERARAIVRAIRSGQWSDVGDNHELIVLAAIRAAVAEVQADNERLSAELILCREEQS